MRVHLQSSTPVSLICHSNIDNSRHLEQLPKARVATGPLLTSVVCPVPTGAPLREVCGVHPGACVARYLLCWHDMLGDEEIRCVSILYVHQRQGNAI